MDKAISIIDKDGIPQNYFTSRLRQLLEEQDYLCAKFPFEMTVDTAQFDNSRFPMSLVDVNDNKVYGQPQQLEASCIKNLEFQTTIEALTI